MGIAGIVAMSRERLLEAIRAACGPAARGGAAPVRTSVGSAAGPGDLPLLPAPQVFADPIALFIDRARQVGVEVETVASVRDAAERAAAWCAERGARRVATWDTLDLAPVVDRLRAGGLEILPPGTPLEQMARADAGITGADWGIAETGTLVVASDPRQPRLTSLLPPAHLAVLGADRIVSDMAALFALGGPPPSALTFITGPSRSADIGFVPTLGAHGPMVVSILLLNPVASLSAATVADLLTGLWS